MPKYIVHVAATGIYSCEVEAETEDEAVELAEEEAYYDADPEWEAEHCEECDN